MLTKDQLQNFKERLEKTKADLEKQVKDLEEKVPDFGSETDHFEEEADEAEAFSTNLGIAKTLRERLVNVNHALDKIAGGTYGRCENCKEMDVPIKNLETNPELRLCRSCE